MRTSASGWTTCVHPMAQSDSPRTDTTWWSSAPARRGWWRRHAAAALGAKVALIERDLLGGDCLNIGCVPSKAIIRTSRLYAEMRNAERYGAQVPADIRVDFPR